jgi:hypothetical protein
MIVFMDAYDMYLHGIFEFWYIWGLVGWSTVFFRTTNQYTQFASYQYEISPEDHYDSVYGCIWHVYKWHLSTVRMVYCVFFCGEKKYNKRMKYLLKIIMIVLMDVYGMYIYTWNFRILVHLSTVRMFNCVFLVEKKKYDKPVHSTC